MKRYIHILLLSAAVVLVGCGISIKYSLSGASIPPEAKTFSVGYFPNNATMVAPILSSTLTDALKNKFSSQTRLQQVEEGGDFAFEGEVVNYTTSTASVSGDDQAQRMRLTITVRVKFTNAVDEAMSFPSGGRVFSQYEEYDANRFLSDVENELIPQIVDKLVTDIFMASASQW